MMYPVVGKYVANCRIGIVSFAVDISNFPFAVPTLILLEGVSNWPYGVLGAIYRLVVPETIIPGCSGGSLFLFPSDT